MAEHDDDSRRSDDRLTDREVRALLAERDRLYNERHNSAWESVWRGITSLKDHTTHQLSATKELVNNALAALEKQTQQTFSAAKEAVEKAQRAQEAHDLKANEIRSQLDAQAKTFSIAKDVDNRFSATEQRIETLRLTTEEKIGQLRDDIQHRLDRQTADIDSLRISRGESGGEKAGAAATRAFIMAGVSLAIALLLALFTIVEKFGG